MNLLKKITILTSSAILCASASYGQYMGMSYQDILTVKAGGNFNTVSYDIGQTSAAGSGFGLALSLAYDYKMGPLLLSFGVGAINAVPRINTTLNNVTTTGSIQTTNSFTADGMLKIAAATGAYIGGGLSAYMPYQSPYPKNTFDIYANAEIGINLQAGDYAFFTPAVRVGYNLTNNNLNSVAGLSNAFNLNIQFLVGVGFRIFNTTGNF